MADDLLILKERPAIEEKDRTADSLDPIGMDSDTLATILAGTRFQNLMSAFWNMVGIPAAIIDLQARVLASSPWQRACTDFHRTNPTTCARCIESDTVLALKLNEGQPFSMYACRNGLTDCASPVIINGKHVANAFVGQFFTAPPDLEFFRRQARECGLDTAEYLTAIQEVPVIQTDKLPSILGFLVAMAEMVAQTSMDTLVARRAEIVMAQRAEELARERAAALRLAEEADRARAEIERYKGHLESLVMARTEELRNSEETIREREEYFRAVFTHAGVGMVGTDEQGAFTQVNEAFKAFSGRTWEELRQLNVLSLIHPDHMARTEAMFRRQISGEINQFQMEQLFLRKDGEPRWADFRSAPIRYRDGRFKAAVMTISDITNRKRIEIEHAARLKADVAMSAAIKLLLGPDTSAPTMEKALGDLLTAARVDRIYLFENQEDSEHGLYGRLKYEATAPGVARLAPAGRRIDRPYGLGFDRWKDFLSQGRPIMGPVDGFPEEERGLLTPLQTVSLLVLPIMVQGRWYGYVGFDDTFQRRDWTKSDLAVLGTTVEIISAFLTRMETDQATIAKTESPAGPRREINDFIPPGIDPGGERP